MKVTLEKDDLIQILAEHFGSEFDVNNITIRTDPLEIEVRNVPLPASEKTPVRGRIDPLVHEEPVVVAQASADDVAVVLRRADSDATVVPPPPGNDETDGDSLGSPLSVVEQSRALEDRLRREKTPRRKGGQASPPPYSAEET